MVIIKHILPGSPHLDTVKQLWREQSDTLGFMPQGAFDEYAARRCILGAFLEQSQCAGYLLYRRTKDRIFIAHLCVAPKNRGQGIAKRLVNELSQLESNYLAIELWCRRDFQANEMWRKLGFVASGERGGRGQGSKLLTCWRRDNPHPTLFAATLSSDQLRAVIDANIFFDLLADARAPRSDSKALLADWLQGSVSLYVTQELFNEIDRNARGPQERKRLRAEASRFEKCLPHPWEEIERIYQALATRLPPRAHKLSDESDLRQLAYTIRSGITLFVTQDSRLLDAEEDIYRSHNVTLIRPSDLILQTDALEQESLYQPRRLSGTALHIGRVQARQDELLAQRLQNPKARESKASFLEQIRKLLAQPSSTTCEWVASPEGEALALVARTVSSGELHIPLFRVASSPLSATLARHLLFHSLKQAVREGCHAIRITDRFLDSETLQALNAESFLETRGGWFRICLSRVASASELLRQLQSLASEERYSSPTLQAYISGLSPEQLSTIPTLAADFERAFWPAKIADARLPSYIVPIQPQWAQHLFDEGLAAHDLFGARLDLALNREAAYYRSASPPHLKTPARILWYVSKDKKGRFGGTGELRACSRLEEVIMDSPKAVFRRFRRLGIYEWRHVLETAGGHIDGRLMALRFCDSEALRMRVSWKQMQTILKESGVRTQLQSPTEITQEVFVRLYNAKLA